MRLRLLLLLLPLLILFVLPLPLGLSSRLLHTAILRGQGCLALRFPFRFDCRSFSEESFDHAHLTRYFHSDSVRVPHSTRFIFLNFFDGPAAFYHFKNQSNRNAQGVCCSYNENPPNAQLNALKNPDILPSSKSRSQSIHTTAS